MNHDIEFEKSIELGKINYSYKNRKCNMVDLSVAITNIRSHEDLQFQVKDGEIEIYSAGKTGVFYYDTLKRVKKEKVVVISGGVWNHMHTDYMMCGQCLDDLLDLMPDNEVLKIVHPIWKEYHSNNLHAGTKGQEEALQLYFYEIGQDYDFSKAVEYLKLIGLYEDRGYKYGSSWLLKPVPGDVIEKLMKIFDPVPTKY